jgi:transcriptional regulator with GAF, ATPase, and Fis domain
VAHSEWLPLESILATQELHNRPAPPDYATENQALVQLAESVATSPDGFLQALSDTAMRLCRGDSAGVSLLESEGGRQLFRWHAASGTMAPYVWHTMLGDSSPCATVLERDAAQLMLYPERHFTALAEMAPPVPEALLMPFYFHGQMAGTIWVLLHRTDRRFDAEDCRVLYDMAHFASAAYKVLALLAASQVEIEELRQENLALQERIHRLAADTLGRRFPASN